MPRWNGCVIACLIILVAACSAEQGPTPPPSDHDVSVVNGVVVGCVSFEQLECEAVARQVLATLPPGAGTPFSILLVLFECKQGGVCRKSLAARDGRATVDIPGPPAPMEFALVGPPNAPAVQPVDVDVRWSPLVQPSSRRVAGVGPFPFDLGHCGLLWQVDFDGSFWVPVGQVDGDAPEVVNSGSGLMRVVGPNLAVYTGAEGFTAGLQRFPGAKHISLCA